MEILEPLNLCSFCSLLKIFSIFRAVEHMVFGPSNAVKINVFDAPKTYGFRVLCVRGMEKFMEFSGVRDIKKSSIFYATKNAKHFSPAMFLKH